MAIIDQGNDSSQPCSSVATRHSRTPGGRSAAEFVSEHEGAGDPERDHGEETEASSEFTCSRLTSYHENDEIAEATGWHGSRRVIENDR